ncbi:hypothetical protein HMI01_13960 [Halolactibacillus miurensis]|uniref:ComG operon protein 7 n=1 Tax=Halolactibacillus miurensis TaxID=306541 RepID=A0ABQ0VTC3_9BACI|nr:hypothetical protein HMI01_13960 [Halolactibacillus miurensis]
MLEALFVLTLLTMIIFIHLPLQQKIAYQQSIERERLSLYHQFYDYILVEEYDEVVTLASYVIVIERESIDNYVKVTGHYLNRSNKKEVMTIYYVPKQQRVYDD